MSCRTGLRSVPPIPSVTTVPPGSGMSVFHERMDHAKATDRSSTGAVAFRRRFALSGMIIVECTVHGAPTAYSTIVIPKPRTSSVKSPLRCWIILQLPRGS